MQFNLTYHLVKDGTKTQTRRPWRDDWIVVTDSQGSILEVREAKNGRLKYRVGQILAVQPGRGQQAIGHIKICKLRKQDVHDICPAEAEAEGVTALYPTVREYSPVIRRIRQRVAFRDLWFKRLHHTTPLALVIEFEVVKEGTNNDHTAI